MKKLGFYKYAPAILESWEDFHLYNFIDVEENQKPVLRFDWSFKRYSGSGKIYYDKKTKMVCNCFGDNFSEMTITKPDRESVLNMEIKYYSTLYNEPGLEEVFNKILSSYFGVN